MTHSLTPVEDSTDNGKSTSVKQESAAHEVNFREINSFGINFHKISTVS